MICIYSEVFYIFQGMCNLPEGKIQLMVRLLEAISPANRLTSNPSASTSVSDAQATPAPTPAPASAPALTSAPALASVPAPATASAPALASVPASAPALAPAPAVVPEILDQSGSKLSLKMSSSASSSMCNIDVTSVQDDNMTVILNDEEKEDDKEELSIVDRSFDSLMEEDIQPVRKDVWKRKGGPQKKGESVKKMALSLHGWLHGGKSADSADTCTSIPEGLKTCPSTPLPPISELMGEKKEKGKSMEDPYSPTDSPLSSCSQRDVTSPPA